MSDILRTGSAWLEARRHQVATSQITYVRGSQAIQVNATIGRTEYDQADDYGVVVRHEARDFLIRAMDLVFDGVIVLPEEGDRIEESQCGSRFVYEVLPISPSQPPYRYSDAFRQTLRIHTKLVGEDTSPCHR